MFCDNGVIHRGQKPASSGLRSLELETAKSNKKYGKMGKIVLFLLLLFERPTECSSVSEDPWSFSLRFLFSFFNKKRRLKLSRLFETNRFHPV
jgi:hypothetical protein